MLSWNRWPSWVTMPIGAPQRVERQPADVDAADRHRRRRRRRRAAGAAQAIVDLPPPDDPTRATTSPGSMAKEIVVEHLVAAASVERGDLLERRQGHLVGGRVGEADVVEGDADRPRRDRRGVRRLVDQRLEVEHLEDPLEADEGGHRVDAGARQRGERRVELAEQQRHRHHRAGVEAAMDGEVAAEAVDEGEGERRHEGEGGEEHVLAHRRAHADLGDPLGPLAELGLLALRVDRTA